MDSKKMVWIGMIIGSTVGGYMPTLWGDSFLSFTSVILSAIGGILGIWLGFKISNY
ncbi:MAG: hypothetical protein AAB513_02565 [Patescibacteria group bacterium]